MNPQQQTQPQQAPVPPPQTPPLHHNSLNWLKLLIGGTVVLFILAVFGVGGYLLGSNKNTPTEVSTQQITTIPTPTPTIDPTASWKTYASDKFGFSVKYPPELQANEDSINFENTVVSFFNGKYDQNCISINIKINSIDSQSTIEQWVTNNRKQIKPSNEIVIPQLNEYMIGDVKGYWIETGSESIGKSILARYGSRILEVNTPSCGPGDHYNSHTDTLKIMDNMILTFKFTNPTGDCKITGCSGQICADEDVITTCEYKEEYACYKTARCEKQTNGKCGWTQTAELNSCLINPQR